jgi:hypothetical protein
VSTPARNHALLETAPAPGGGGRVVAAPSTWRSSERCRCGAPLARDRAGTLCRPCEAAALTQPGPPQPPSAFWDHPPLVDALAEQHMGRVIRVYRHHPWHGLAPLPQEVVGRWLNVTQCQVSRLESGPPRANLDWLRFVARTLLIPPSQLWFAVNGQATIATPDLTRAARSASAPSPPTPLVPRKTGNVAATVRLEVTPGTQMTVTLDQDSRATIRLLINTLPEALPDASVHLEPPEHQARVYSLDARRKNA